MEKPSMAAGNSSVAVDHDQHVIRLRRIQISDIDDFLVWASDDRVTRYTRWDSFTSKDEALNFIKNYAIPHPWFRVICVDNRPIGSISFAPNSVDGIDKCRSEVSYSIAFEYWGKGIAIKAWEMAASSIFEEWPHIERIDAFALPENKAVQRSLEKAGFVKEGLLRNYRTIKGKSRDLLVFSLLSSDHHASLLIKNGGLRISSSL